MYYACRQAFTFCCVYIVQVSKHMGRLILFYPFQTVHIIIDCTSFLLPLIKFQWFVSREPFPFSLPMTPRTTVYSEIGDKLAGLDKFIPKFWDQSWIVSVLLLFVDRIHLHFNMSSNAVQYMIMCKVILAAPELKCAIPKGSFDCTQANANSWFLNQTLRWTE
jgi:hypothetical protein